MSPAAIDAAIGRLIGPGSPFEMTASPGGAGTRVFRHAPGSLGAALLAKMRSRGDAPLAVIGGETLTYARALQRASRAAACLKNEAGNDPRGRVAIILPNGADWLVTFLAVTLSGRSAVLISDFEPTRLRQSIRSTRPRLLIGDGTHARWLAQEFKGIPAVTLGDLEARQDERPESGFAGPDDECLVLFTSGSTGVPKPVRLSNRNVVSGMLNMLLAGAIAASGVPRRSPAAPRMSPCPLVHLPLAYVSSLTSLLLSIWSGGRTEVIPSWDCLHVAELLDRKLITAIGGANDRQLLELLEAQPDAASLATLGMFGGRWCSRLLDEVAQRWPHTTVVTGYGMTETAGGISSRVLHDPRSTAGILGRIVPTVEHKIVDAEGASMPDNRSGHLMLRGPNIMLGYGDEGPGLVGGWLPTNDIARISGDGELVIERRESIPETGGADGVASPRSLEDMLMACPSVAEAAVLSRAHAGGSVVSRVALAGAREHRVSFDEIQAVLREGAARAGEALEFLLCEQFPRTASGKVDLAALRRRCGDRPADFSL